MLCHYLGGDIIEGLHTQLFFCHVKEPLKGLYSKNHYLERLVCYVQID